MSTLQKFQHWDNWHWSYTECNGNCSRLWIKRLDLDSWPWVVAMHMVSGKSLPLQILVSWFTKWKCEYLFCQPPALVWRSNKLINVKMLCGLWSTPQIWSVIFIGEKNKIWLNWLLSKFDQEVRCQMLPAARRQKWKAVSLI